MPFQLKPRAEIAAIVEGKDHAKIPAKRRAHLAEKVVAAGNEVTHTLPVMIAHAGSAEEAAFLRALVTEIPPVAPENSSGKKDGGASEQNTGADDTHV